MKNQNVSPGEIIKIGKYDWRVLEVQKDRALLLSEYVIDWKAYSTKTEPELTWVGEYMDYKLLKVTWKDCTLRQYLNEEFFHSFGDQEKSLILTVENINENNQWNNTNGGDNTKDRIFLLSIAEIVKYFGDSKQLKKKQTWKVRGKLNEYQPWRYDIYFIDDEFNNKRKAFVKRDADYWCEDWWLRSPGIENDRAACISREGCIIDKSVSTCKHVRPALWLKL